MQEKNNKTKIVLGVIFVASIAVIIGSLSYAYFSIDTSDNKNQEVVIQSGTMQLRFADNDTGFNGKLNFGESAEKLFILENTGTLPSKAKINFINMVNTYQKGSLTYKLEYKTTEEGTTWTEIKAKKNVPISSIASKTMLANNLEVPVGQKYYYRLTVTLENLEGVDQTQDINAVFSTEFNLEEASETGAEKLLAKKNPASVTTYTDGIGTEMYTFNHEATEQTPALTDYRYIGPNPNNYIEFNDEVWRIIGVFPVLNSETNEYEDRIKIMRSKSIGDMAWNTIRVNTWKTSTIASALNGDYYNRQNSFSSIGLTARTKEQISDAIWYLGASWHYNTGIEAYAAERSTTKVSAGNQDIYVNQIVGLIYPSDYLYTFANGVNITCFSNQEWCQQEQAWNSWLYKDIVHDSNNSWMITPLKGYSENAHDIRSDGEQHENGKVASPYVTGIYSTHPTLYLKPNIELKRGTGSSLDPYIID